MPDITNNGRKLSKNNTSGYTGVSYETAAGKYRAYVHYSGEKIPLGYFLTTTEAARARAEAQQFYKMPLVDRLRLVDYLSDKFDITPDEALLGVIMALQAFRWGEKISITTHTTNYIKLQLYTSDDSEAVVSETKKAAFFDRARSQVKNLCCPPSELKILTQWLNGMSMARIARESGRTATEVERELVAARIEYLRQCFH